MTATRPPLGIGPLAVRVKELSPGLFFWTVNELSAQEHVADVCIDTSDHPYLSHEAAMSAGTACLKALKAAANGTSQYVPHAASSSPQSASQFY
jgi:hypothetical protein